MCIRITPLKIVLRTYDLKILVDYYVENAERVGEQCGVEHLN